MPSKVLNFKSPIAILCPNHMFLLPPKIFRCLCFVHTQQQDRTKLDPQPIKCVFIGYHSSKTPPIRAHISRIGSRLARTDPSFTLESDLASDRAIRGSSTWIRRSWAGSANPEPDRRSTVRTKQRPVSDISSFLFTFLSHAPIFLFFLFLFLINHNLTSLSLVLNKFLRSKTWFVADLSGLKEEILGFLHKTQKGMIFYLNLRFNSFFLQ